MTATLDETDEVPDYLAGMTLEDDEDAKPKRTRRRRSPSVDDDGTPRTRQPRNAKLQEELLEGYVSLATDLATVMPTVSGVLIHRAERSVDGIVKLAQGHPRVMKALRTSAKFGHAADVLQTLFLVAVAAMIDMGRIPVDHPILDTLGDVSIAKDANGKAIRDGAGRIQKERVTLREIYETMHGTDSGTPEQVPFPMPDFSSPFAGGPTTMPPMNWSPR